MPKELFSLGKIYPSDFLKEGEQPTTEPVELKLIMDDDRLVRLEKTAPMNQMYGKYWYRSGINSTMREALKDVVDSILKVQKVKRGDVWLDIACNDGTLLSYVPEYFYKLGIDPAEDSYKNEAIRNCDSHVQDFFSLENYKKATGRKAKVVTSIAMFYDVPDPKRFIKDVYDILEDDGIWVMQLSYSPLMIEQMAFDNICHEHIYYYSLGDINELIKDCGMYVSDFELNEVNGGSMRVFIRKGIKGGAGDVKQYKVSAFLVYEEVYMVHKAALWDNFFKDVEKLKDYTVSFIAKSKQEGKSIWAYGASTKGNTLLQYFGLNNTLIDAIADRNPSKHGLRTIGSNIPIKSEEEMREAQPDYLLILPWHFIEEFKEREKEYLRKGGKFIVPCPEFKIISYEDIK